MILPSFLVLASTRCAPLAFLTRLCRSYVLLSQGTLSFMTEHRAQLWTSVLRQKIPWLAAMPGRWCLIPHSKGVQKVPWLAAMPGRWCLIPRQGQPEDQAPVLPLTRASSFVGSAGQPSRASPHANETVNMCVCVCEHAGPLLGENGAAENCEIR